MESERARDAASIDDVMEVLDRLGDVVASIRGAIERLDTEREALERLARSTAAGDANGRGGGEEPVGRGSIVICEPTDASGRVVSRDIGIVRRVRGNVASVAYHIGGTCQMTPIAELHPISNGWFARGVAERADQLSDRPLEGLEPECEDWSRDPEGRPRDDG